MSKDGSKKSSVDVEMMTAIALGDAAGFEKALARLADVDGQDSEGLTPLMMCIESAQWPMAAKLLEKGASAHPVDQEGRSALDYALRAKHEKLCMRLLKLGADQSKASQWLGANGSIAMVENLLSWNGWDQGEMGGGVVSSSRSGRVDALALFLKAGASPDASDEQDVRAVEHAALKNSMSCMAMLIDAGADLRKRYASGADMADISEALGSRADIVEHLRAAIFMQSEKDELSRSVSESVGGPKIRL